ncbi:MAG: glycogen/starch synthase [Saprospiraceae bacterium]|nr:glycogen/starch synthase [Saprospiraceae bacterium]
MKKKRVLIITQEMEPYTTISETSKIARRLPQYVQEHGMEIRVLMPRFGTINERRHRLHEVVRLSGMNIIVDEDDYPLIIKVASLPGTRMQVYFLDNEEFFKRKQIFTDEKGKPFADNADRMIFFCKGALETVKKFGWAPDIIHCHGWMTSLVPFYLRTAYKNEPIFQKAKVIYSVYKNNEEKSLSKRFAEKASINNLEPADLKAYQNGKGVTLHQGASQFSDALIVGSDDLSKGVKDKLNKLKKPILDNQDEEGYLAAYLDFYKELLAS